LDKVDKATAPLGPRRGIATALRQLRVGSGKSLNQVAKDVMFSTSKLSRLENAQGRPLARDIRDLIRYYGIEGNPLAVRMWQWVDEAQSPGWWTDYGEEVLKGGLDVHLAYEDDATVERTYTLPFVPALLQTTDYAQVLFRDMEQRSEKQVSQLLKVRTRRQQALRSREGLPPLKLVAVTHETSLRQAVGSPGIMRDQLDALIERSMAPNVNLHVLPLAADPLFSMTCMYAYFEYQDSLEQDVVHVETHAGFFSIEDPARVARYRAVHRALVDASLNEDSSRDLIRCVRDDMPYAS
jgi:transcriptional regulator with XRE-family HTH domain